MIFKVYFSIFFCISDAMLDSRDMNLGVLGVSIIALNVVWFLQYSKGVCSTPNRSQFFDLAV